MSVRQAAVRELARGWKDDPDTFDLLCDRAVNDPFVRKGILENNPRQTALEAIARLFPDHPQTTDLLKDRAENDPDEQTREYAKKVLERTSK